MRAFTAFWEITRGNGGRVASTGSILPTKEIVGFCGAIGGAQPARRICQSTIQHHNPDGLQQGTNTKKEYPADPLSSALK